MLRKEQPLAGEIRDQRVRARIGEHALHLRSRTGFASERARARQGEQLVVRNAAPEEERQPRRQLEVADRDRRCPARAGGIELDAEQELRADEDRLKRESECPPRSRRAAPRRRRAAISSAGSPSPTGRRNARRARWRGSSRRRPALRRRRAGRQVKILLAARRRTRPCAL